MVVGGRGHEKPPQRFSADEEEREMIHASILRLYRHRVSEESVTKLAETVAEAERLHEDISQQQQNAGEKRVLSGSPVASAVLRTSERLVEGDVKVALNADSAGQSEGQRDKRTNPATATLLGPAAERQPRTPTTKTASVQPEVLAGSSSVSSSSDQRARLRRNLVDRDEASDASSIRRQLRFIEDVYISGRTPHEAQQADLLQAARLPAGKPGALSVCDNAAIPSSSQTPPHHPEIQIDTATSACLFPSTDRRRPRSCGGSQSDDTWCRRLDLFSKRRSLTVTHAATTTIASSSLPESSDPTRSRMGSSVMGAVRSEEGDGSVVVSRPQDEQARSREAEELRTNGGEAMQQQGSEQSAVTDPHYGTTVKPRRLDRPSLVDMLRLDVEEVASSLRAPLLTNPRRSHLSWRTSMEAGDALTPSGRASAPSHGWPQGILGQTLKQGGTKADESAPRGARLGEGIAVPDWSPQSQESSLLVLSARSVNDDHTMPEGEDGNQSRRMTDYHHTSYASCSKWVPESEIDRHHRLIDTFGGEARLSCLECKVACLSRDCSLHSRRYRGILGRA